MTRRVSTAPIPVGHHHHRSSRRLNAASNNLRYFWMVATGLLGGFSTFVIYDRMYHAVEVSNLMVVSIDTMNVVQSTESLAEQMGHKIEHLLHSDRQEMELSQQHHHQQQQSDNEDEEEEYQPPQPPAQEDEEDETALREELEGDDDQEDKKPPEEPEAIRPEPKQVVHWGDSVIHEANYDDNKPNKKIVIPPGGSHNNNKPDPQTTTGPKQMTQQVEIQPTDVVRSLESLADDDEDRYKVHFMTQPQVNHKDSFSASWLQSKTDFMDMNLDAVKICEDAAFKAWNTRKDKLRMTMDYFDFSVEHLSKWWKLLDYYASDIVYQSVVQKLGAYIRNGATDYPIVGNTNLVLGETVATIAFQPYKVSGRWAKEKLPVERAWNLTVVSLAATIESLRRAEMGRVVVVGSEESHEQYTKAAIDYLHTHLKVPTIGQPGNAQLVGHVEVGYVEVTPEQTRTKMLARNMPKGCLVGAREAFEIADKDPTERSDEEIEVVKDWFGTARDPLHWKYLYLTEPDSILTTRASSLPQIKEEIDLRGGIISPFRLQPIPHESDIRGYKLKDRFLPEADGFENVLELDHYADQHDVCCDEHAGPDHRPGKSEFPECGHKKWFLCGFEEKVPTEDPHRRLRPYQLFRLTKGTGLTTIAGNLFARRCFPGQNAVCRPPPKAPKKNRRNKKN